MLKYNTGAIYIDLLTARIKFTMTCPRTILSCFIREILLNSLSEKWTWSISTYGIKQHFNQEIKVNMFSKSLIHNHNLHSDPFTYQFWK